MHRIHSYSKNGSLEEVKREIGLYQKSGTLSISINNPDGLDKYTPLMWAAKNGHFEVVKILCQTDGILLDQKGGWNESTALIKAAESNHYRSTIALLDAHADMNMQNDFKSTALMIASERGHKETVDALLQRKADPNLQNSLKYTALILAAEKNHSAVVRLLCEANANLNAKNKFGKTALMMAAEFGSLPCVEILLKYKVDIDAVSNRDMTALILASLKGHVAIVTMLIENGANVNIQNIDGETALMLSFISKKTEISQCLLKNGADKSIKSKLLRTSLMKAAECGGENVKMILEMQFEDKLRAQNHTVIKRLGSHCSNSKCNKHFTGHVRKYFCQVCGESFCISCSSHYVAMTLNASASSSHILTWEHNLIGRSCDSCHGGYLETRNLVTPVYKDIFMTDNEGSSALHFAAKKGHLVTFTKLMDYGGDIYLKDHQGRTPLDLLADFYVDDERKNAKKDETRFRSEYVKLAVQRMDLLEMITDILPKFDSPNAVLNKNNCFHKLLLGLKPNETNDDDLSIVNALVRLSVGLVKAADKHPLETVDLDDKLSIVSNMLVNCLAGQCLDKEQNLVLAFQDEKMKTRHNASKDVARARGLLEGPLSLCLDNNILCIFQARQIPIYINTVFHNCLRRRGARPVYDYIDLFQMRTNCAYWRSCPAVNFYLEALSKVLLLVIVSAVAIHPSAGRELAIFLVVLWVGFFVHEIGELANGDFMLADYLNSSHSLDALSLALLAGWIGLAISENDLNLNYYDRLHLNQTNINGTWFYSGPWDRSIGLYTNDDKETSIVVDWKNDNLYPSPKSKALLALSAIPIALGLLRYIATTSQDFGQHLLMIVSMSKELGKFLVVLLIGTLGFVIVFIALFPRMVFLSTPVCLTYQSCGRSGGFFGWYDTFLTLFNALMAEHDFSIFETEPYRAYGVIMFAIFKVFSMVILLNLVIARFSAKHNEIMEQALEMVCLMKAQNVKQYLAIQELNPLSMLPAPLNLVTTILAPLHYALINLAKANFWKKSSGVTEHNSPQVISLCGTVSDKLIGGVCLLPCAAYEIYLCLVEIKEHATPKTYMIACILAIIFSPLLWLIFVVVLFYELIMVKSILVINDDGEELDYTTKQIASLETTPAVDLNQHKQYTVLEVRVLRAEFDKVYRLCIPNAYVVVSLGDQRLVTPTVKCNGKTFTYVSACDKKFFVWFGEHTNAADRVIEFCVYDSNHQCLGQCRKEFDPWIANGRFEGNLEVKLKTFTVGIVAIAVKCFKDNVKPVITTTLSSIAKSCAGSLTTPFRQSLRNQHSDMYKHKASGSDFKTVSSMLEEDDDEDDDNPKAPYVPDVSVTLTVVAAELTKLNFAGTGHKENSFTAQVTFGEEAFSTSHVYSSDWSPFWKEDFFVELPTAAEIKKDRLKLGLHIVMTNNQGDEEVLGSCAHYIGKWIQSNNEDMCYEGALDLFLDGEVVGNVYVVITPSNGPVDDHSSSALTSLATKHAHYRNKTFSTIDDSPIAPPIDKIQKEVAEEGRSSLKFTDAEIEKIFHGIQDEYYLPPKNPYAHEVRREFNHQLSQFSREVLDQEFAAIQEQLNLYNDSNMEMFHRVKLLRAALEIEEKQNVDAEPSPNNENTPKMQRVFSSHSMISMFSYIESNP